MPLSPYLINLRGKDASKPGNLEPQDFELIAQCMWEMILKKAFNFNAIAGVPYGGEKIVKALVEMLPEPKGFEVLKLGKETRNGRRRIVADNNFEYKSTHRVLLVDDVCTGGNSGAEAIDALQRKRVKVTNFAVLVNRGQGGRKIIEDQGAKFLSNFTALELLDYGHKIRKISEDIYHICRKYIVINRMNGREGKIKN